MYWALKRDVGIGVWKNSGGEKIIVTPTVWSQQAEDYTFMGYNAPYDFDKAVWRAGLGQPFLLVLKMVMANEGTQVYHLERPEVNAIVIVNHIQMSSMPTWVANANVYPKDDQPYTVDSASRSLERALIPIHMTLDRYQKGD